MRKQTSCVMGALFCAFLAPSVLGQQGTLVVGSDDWIVSDVAYSRTTGTSQFVTNMTDMFADGGPGRFLAYSNNFGYSGTQLMNTMNSNGHQFVRSMSVPFDLNTLLTYDGIFLGGSMVPDIQIIVDYLNAGGNVYLYGGSGTIPGGATGEAAYWNQLLTQAGLAFAAPYDQIVNTVVGSVSTERLLSGVPSVYVNNGNSIVDLDPEDMNEIMLSHNGRGIIAMAHFGQPIPAPASALILGAIPFLQNRRRR